MQFKVAHDLLGIAGRPFPILLRLGLPDPGHPLKGVEVCDALVLRRHASRLTGIDTIGALFCFGTRPLARACKCHDRVVPKAELGLLALPLVAIDPHFAARTHAKVETVAVRQQIFLVTRCCRLDLKLG